MQSYLMTTQDSDYAKHLAAYNGNLDLAYWRNPEGVHVPDDELRFLLIPDAIEAAAVADVAKQIHKYQRESQDTRDQISRAIIVTMGGMLPGVLLYDHLVEGRDPQAPKLKFGTVGVSLYKGPGVRHEKPLVQHGISIPISGRTVLLIDDLGDYGGTMKFLTGYMSDSGAHKVLNMALYMKPAALETCRADFYFGETPQDTWIITPRERVETLVKRVPVWRDRGADINECRRRLIDIIGYSPSLVDDYLPGVFARQNGKEE